MSMTAKDLVQQAKQTIEEVSIEQANALWADGALALDVREPAEFEAGHISNAHHIARGLLEFKIGGHEGFQNKDAKVVVYCKSGGRSALAASTLKQMGFSDVVSMAGGYDEWAAS